MWAQFFSLDLFSAPQAVGGSTDKAAHVLSERTGHRLSGIGQGSTGPTGPGFTGQGLLGASQGGEFLTLSVGSL